MYDIDDLLVLIPTKGRHDLLNQAVDSFLETTKKSQLCIIFDDEQEIFWPSPRVSSVRTPKRMGYWGALNVGFDLFPYPLLGYFANDVIFHEGWETISVRAYNKYFPDGKGLLALRDEVWNEYHAAHGIISREWLSVLYDNSRFPSEYGHHYGDSELTQFSKDLRRFRYCEEAYVEHLHPDNDKRGKDEIDAMSGDILGVKEAKALYDFRYKMWDTKGRKQAMEKL